MAHDKTPRAAKPFVCVVAHAGARLEACRTVVAAPSKASAATMMAVAPGRVAGAETMSEEEIAQANLRPFVVFARAPDGWREIRDFSD